MFINVNDVLYLWWTTDESAGILFSVQVFFFFLQLNMKL